MTINDEEYYRLVKAALTKMRVNFDDDLLQELTTFTYIKIKDSYSEDKGALSSFVYAVVKNRYLQLYKRCKSPKNAFNSQLMSLDETFDTNKDCDSTITLMDMVSDPVDPLFEFNKRKTIELIMPLVIPELNLYINGISQKEIARRKGVTHQSVQCKISRNIEKIRNFLESQGYNL